MELINETPTGTTTPSQSKSWSNDDKGLVYASQICRTGASPLDAFQSHTQGTPILLRGSYPSAGVTVSRV